MTHQNRVINKRTVGARFEALAAQYLEQKGYQILARNFRCRQGEIDLIAQDGEYTVFIEVKYRTSEQEGNPLEAVDRRKIRRIVHTARYYMMQYGLPQETACRFDVIGLLDGRIEHIENAFDAN